MPLRDAEPYSFGAPVFQDQVDSSPAVDSGEESTPMFQTFTPGTREYKRDLKRRKGGLIPSRKADAPMIKQTLQEIADGTLTDDQVQALIIRNPKSATFFASALQKRRQAEKIFGAGTQLPQEESRVNPILGTEDQDITNDAALLGQAQINPNKILSAALQENRTDLLGDIRKIYGLNRNKTAKAGKVYKTKIIGPDGVERVVGLSEPQLRGGVVNFKRIPNKDASDIDQSLAVLKNVAVPLMNALNPKISAKKRAELKSKGIIADPNAVGAKGVLPDVILNRIDPKGTSVRQLASNLSSAILKLRSGVAVSHQEFARMEPFLLTGKETSAEALKKSIGLVREFMAILRERNARFSNENGYVPHKGLQRFFSKNKNVGAIKSGAESSGDLTPEQQKRLEFLRKKQGR